jgi:hypothetical protein
MRIASTAVIAVAVSLACADMVFAQTGNTPYSPGVSRVGAGISLGYRQAILNAKILGQRPRALVRGPSGELLTVQRSGRNALVLNPGDGSYVPGARPNAGWPTGLGSGLGWNLVAFSGAASGYRSAPAQSLNSWISQIPSGPDGSASSLGVFGDGSSPIDTWIMQLEQI